jgi:hypothetical protein
MMNASVEAAIGWNRWNCVAKAWAMRALAPSAAIVR